MTIKKQLLKIKENWLLALILILLIMFFTNLSPINTLTKISGRDYGIAESSMTRGAYYDEGFAPEVEERVITKTANLQTEIKKGSFKKEEAKLKEIIKNEILLNENVYTNDKNYVTANYQIKVNTENYEEIINKLKKIGEVKSFSENSYDITKRYVNTKTELEAEKERLERYEQMYSEARDIKDKIELNDRIFNQERTIKYLEENLKNINNKVDYSTVYFTISEKSDFVNVSLIKISEIVRAFVDSVNYLIKLIFIIIPWAVIIWILYLIKKKFF